MAGVVGLDQKIYRNTGTYGTPVWNEITITMDLTTNHESEKAEARIRGNSAVQTKPLHQRDPIDLTILADTAVDDYNALRDAWLNRTVLDLAVADGAIATTGTQYWRADYYAYGFARGEPIDGFATVNIPLDLAVSSNTRGFVTV